MNIDERLKYAENRRDESITNGTDYDCAYWNGYLDGLKAVQRDIIDISKFKGKILRKARTRNERTIET